MYSRLEKSEKENSRTEIPEGWLEKRRKTMIIFFVQNFIVGMEYSIFTLTAWLYITTLIETSRPKLLYGLTTSSFFISGIILSPIYGRIVDKTRQSKIAFIIGNTAVCVGNFLYAIQISQYCLVAGRFISGFGAPIKAVMNSEIARSYPKETVSKIYSIMGIAFALGFIIGPALNFIFLNVDFQLFGKIHFTDGNIVGVYMGCIFFLMNVIALVFMSDLSKEFDLKEATENMNELQNENNEQHSKKQHLMSFCSRKVVFMLILTFMFRCLLLAYDTSLPVIVLNKLNWSELRLNYVFVSLSVVGIITITLTACRPPSEAWLYKILVLGEILMILLIASMYIIVQLRGHLEYIVLVLFCQGIMFNIIDIVDEICLPTIFSYMVYSEHQTFAEAFRLSCARIGSLVALMTTTYLCDVILEWFVTVAVIMLPLIMITLLKKDVFIIGINMLTS